ncbi:hypothetical protein [Mycetohabitans sp. B46]|uniref:hypothetical protein n=1 Tax=Mycetohabitans sp. B46 TaxID=2772536 RepID=UPI00309C7AA2
MAGENRLADQRMGVTRNRLSGRLSLWWVCLFALIAACIERCFSSRRAGSALPARVPGRKAQNDSLWRMLAEPDQDTAHT